MNLRLDKAALITVALGIVVVLLIVTAALFVIRSRSAGANPSPSGNLPNPEPALAVTPPDKPAPAPPEPPLRKPVQVLGDRRFLTPGYITAVVPSPDGKVLAVAAQTFPSFGPIILFDAATGEEISRLKGHERLVNRMAFSPDGATLYTGGNAATPLTLGGRPDQLLRSWDVAARRETWCIQAHDWALTPDGRRLVTMQTYPAGNHWPGRRYPGGFVLDVSDPGLRKGLWSHRDTGRMAASVAITPDGRIIACGGTDGTVRLWEWAADKELPPLSGLKESVHILAFSPDGKTLAGSSAEFPRDASHPVVLWDWLRGTEMHRLVAYESWHGRPPVPAPDGPVIAMAFTPDGKYLFANDRVWDATTGAECARLSDERRHVLNLSFSADGAMVYAADYKLRPLAVEFASRKEIPLPPAPVVRPAALPFETANPLPGPLTFDADVPLSNGTALHNARGDGGWGIRLLGPTGVVIRQFVPGCAAEFACSPDGKTLAIFARQGGVDTAVHLWDVATGRDLGRIAADPEPYSRPRFSPDGSRLAVRHRDGIVRLYDVPSRRPLLRLDPEDCPYGGLIFSKDGRFLVGGSNASPTVIIWDITTAGRAE